MIFISEFLYFVLIQTLTFFNYVFILLNNNLVNFNQVS